MPPPMMIALTRLSSRLFVLRKLATQAKLSNDLKANHLKDRAT
jgi:hypothetical protein